MLTNITGIEKRILPLILTVLLLPALLAVPVMADDSGSLVEILDYGFPNDSGNTLVGVTPGSNTVKFDLPYSTQINYIDIVLTMTSLKPTSIYLVAGSGEAQLNIVNIYGSLYRVYGDGLSSIASGFTLRFEYADGVSGTTWATFKSVKVSVVPMTRYEMSLVGTLYNYGDDSSSQVFTYQADGTAHSVSFTALSEFDNSFLADMTPYDWQRYDYVDIWCSAWCQSIISVTAFLSDGTVVPLDVSTLVAEQAENTALHIVSIRVDLSSIQRSTSEIMQIQVTGSMFRGETCAFTIHHCIGGMKTESVNPIVYWLMKIPDTIAQWGQNIVEALGGTGDASQVQENIDSAVGELKEAGAALDAVDRPDIGQVNIDVAGMVPTAGLAGFSGIVSVFLDNSLIYMIVLMSLTLSLVGFVLFGRR